MLLFIAGPTIVVSDILAQLMKILAFAKLSIQIEIVTIPTKVESIASSDEPTVEGVNLSEKSKLETSQESSGHMMGPPLVL